MLIYYVLKTQYSVSRPFLVSNFIVVFLNYNSLQYVLAEGDCLTSRNGTEPYTHAQRDTLSSHPLHVLLSARSSISV